VVEPDEDLGDRVSNYDGVLPASVSLGWGYAVAEREALESCVRTIEKPQPNPSLGNGMVGINSAVNHKGIFSQTVSNLLFSYRILDHLSPGSMIDRGPPSISPMTCSPCPCTVVGSPILLVKVIVASVSR
jgi:hypothetical protein